jgi:hypothetical protein
VGQIGALSRCAVQAGSLFPNKVNEDGALAFYYRPENGYPYRCWVFIKFGTQELPA